MKENNIFLKEESLFISKVNSLFNNKEYLQVAALRHKVFENIDLYKKTEVIYQVASSLFFGRFFEETISFIDELRKKEVESMIYSFYYLASCIALDDINLAKSYLKRSKLMNDNYISEIISEDGANYSSILNVENIDDIPCLLLINYVNEFDKEGKDVEKDFKEEDIRVYKYFEMIDNIYLLNYDSEIVDYMINIGKLLFQN